MQPSTVLTAELMRTVHQWADAIVTNDARAIDSFIAPEWVLVTAEAGIVPRERFLEAVCSGRLRHDTMSHEISRIQSYADGEIGVVTTRGRNTGYFLGAALNADEWTTEIFERRNNRWICVLTHLTPVASPNLNETEPR